VPDPEAFAKRIGFPGVVLGADRNEWTVDAAMLDIPMPRPDPALSAFLEGVLAPQVAPFLDAPLAERTRALVAARLALGAPSLSEAAAELGVAARTLQRRLAEAGTRYDVLLDEERRRVFARCRARGLAMEDAAILCGYADASSFHRARRRWRRG
jgi:AraC-like DNA-binding protein